MYLDSVISFSFLWQSTFPPNHTLVLRFNMCLGDILPIIDKKILVLKKNKNHQGQNHFFPLSTHHRISYRGILMIPFYSFLFLFQIRYFSLPLILFPFTETHRCSRVSVSTHQLGDAASFLMSQLMTVIGIMETGAVYQKIKEKVIKIQSRQTTYIYSSLLFLQLCFSKILYLHPFGSGKMTHANVHNRS